MQKTPFAGLTVLEPDESIYADNSAFITRDRVEIDRLGKIGAKLHRHTGLAGLGNPTIVPSGQIIGSGGTIPAGISLTLGYTLEDSVGGETQLSPTVLLTTPPPFDVPTSAPVAVLDTTTGSLDVDTFTYAVTWSDGEGGETPIGPTTTIDRPPGFGSARIKLSGLDDGMAEAGAVEWRLYRARSGGQYVFLASGTGDTFNDDGTAVAQCDVHPPTSNVNTTGGTNQLKYTIPTGSAIAAATWINLYASQEGTFDESCLLMQVPVGSAGASVIFPSLELLDWQPPDVNRSYGGASQIDPDTELIDWHWKRPVETVEDLPEDAEEGDARMVMSEDTPTVYFFWDGEWQQFTAGGSNRTWVTAKTAKLANGASGKITLKPGGESAHFIKLKTNRKCRVRVYGDEAARTADEARPIGTDPEGDHGVQLDYAITTVSGDEVRLTPIVHGVNLDDPAEDLVYLTVTNEDTEGVVEVEILSIPIEFA